MKKVKSLVKRKGNWSCFLILGVMICKEELHLFCVTGESCSKFWGIPSLCKPVGEVDLTSFYEIFLSFSDFLTKSWWSTNLRHLLDLQRLWGFSLRGVMISGRSGGAAEAVVLRVASRIHAGGLCGARFSLWFSYHGWGIPTSSSTTWCQACFWSYIPKGCSSAFLKILWEVQYLLIIFISTYIIQGWYCCFPIRTLNDT